MRIAYAYDPNAKPWNTGTPWADCAVADLMASLQAGDDVVEVALFLQWPKEEVRAKSLGSRKKGW